MVDFIAEFKDKRYYYYYDNYPLDQSYYDYSLNYYLNFFKNVQKNENLEFSVSAILKLKMLSQKLPETNWDFPVVIHNHYFMAVGSGRIIVDKFVFNKENKKTIMISDYALDGKRIESLNELLHLININGVRFYTKDGIIANMFTDHSFDIKRKYYLNHFKQDLIKSINDVNINDLDSVVYFLKINEPFFKPL
jgi:hypothetical protein